MVISKLKIIRTAVACKNNTAERIVNKYMLRLTLFVSNDVSNK